MRKVHLMTWCNIINLNKILYILLYLFILKIKTETDFDFFFNFHGSLRAEGLNLMSVKCNCRKKNIPGNSF